MPGKLTLVIISLQSDDNSTEIVFIEALLQSGSATPIRLVIVQLNDKSSSHLFNGNTHRITWNLVGTILLTGFF